MQIISSRRFQVPFILIGTLSAYTLTHPAPLSAQSINCANPSSNVEYKECAYRDYKAADQRLNVVYQQIIDSLSGQERKQLVDAQLAWIKFRDSNCDFEVYRNRGGSGYGGFLSNCLERMTKARTAELQNWRR